MKKLGIIGGAGPLASALLYETLVQESYCQGNQLPEILLINYPFTRGLTLQEGKDNGKILENELHYCVNTLVQNGVEVGLIACNTLHLYINQLKQVPLSFFSLPDLVVQKAREKGHGRLLILGTQNTCRSLLYQKAGITTYYLSQQEQKRLDEVIDRVLEGKICKEDSRLIGHLVQQYSEHVALDGIVLGCTDLPVLHHHFPIPSSKPIYDSIKIPAKTLIGIL